MRLPRVTPLVGSLALHALAALLLLRAARTPPRPPPQKPVQVAVIEKRPEPPPPPETPKPPPPKPPPPPPMKLAKPKPLPPPETPKPLPPPPPQPKAPPPPTVEAKTPTPPVVLPGITMESTSQGGSFAVNTGNTLYGDPGKTGRAPGTAKPYKAQRYASSAQVTDLPSCDVNPGALRKYYPLDAQRSNFEGDVTLKLLIDSDGAIVKVDVVSDPGQGLGTAAAKLVRAGEVRCRAARVNGQAVATTVPYVVRFQLD